MDRRVFLGAGVAATAAAQTRVMPAPHEFAAVAVKWTEEAPPVARFRASRDGVKWTEWRSLDADPHSGGRTALLIFEEGCRYLESDSGRALDIRFIDTGSDSTEVRPRPRTEENNGRPPMVSRIEWGSPDGDRMRGNPVYTNVTHLIVHHTADGPLTNFAAWVRAIWNFHVNSNGWADIGYNYLIAPDGTIFEGRAGGDNVVGAHFSCQNGNTMGVAILGDYTRVAPPAAAMDALARLLAWRASALRLNVLSSTVHAGTRLDLPVISSHRDGNPSPLACTRTACPGDMLYPLLPRLRNEVASLMTGALLWSPEPGSLWRAEEGGVWRYGDARTETYDTAGRANRGFLESTPLSFDWPVQLEYESWYQTEDSGLEKDRKLVEISVNGGEWTAIDQVDGDMEAWNTRTVAIAAEGRFRIRFRFDSVDEFRNNYTGWRIRNLAIVPRER